MRRAGEANDTANPRPTPLLVDGGEPNDPHGDPPMLRVRLSLEAVVFDVGETLVDESRAWREEARRAGVSELTLFAVLGALIERGVDHGLWDFLGVAPPKEPVRIEPGDLYPDALRCLRAVHDLGNRVGIAGNQPLHTETMLRSLDVPLDFVASSAGWGVEKPAPEFFARVTAELGVPPDQVVYVGDRLDNDILPAAAAGMVTVLIRRGPWGCLHACRPEAAVAHARIDGLDELPAVLRRVGHHVS